MTLPSAERLARRLLAPITGPQTKRLLISARDGGIAALGHGRARARARTRTPDFLIAGAQKAGTTYLYQELVRHPDVRPALTKEIHYFDDGYRRGARWYGAMFPAGGGVTGEASPGYLFHPHALERAARDAPRVKVVLLLRDPVQRAHSHYLHERRLGFETAASFAEAVCLEDERLNGELDRMREDERYTSHAWRHFSYVRRGEYVDQVHRAIEALGQDRVLLVPSERMFSDPVGVLRTVEEFLGLRDWTPDTFGHNDMAARHSPIAATLHAELAAHFGPFNQRLRDEHGFTHSWD